MKLEEFSRSVEEAMPPAGVGAPLEALWWDAKGEWAREHALVDALETKEGMAVHASLHRKEGEQWNANPWYRRSGEGCRRETLEGEWEALVRGQL